MEDEIRYGITLNWNPALVAKSGYIMPGADAHTEAQEVYATEFGFSMATKSTAPLKKSAVSISLVNPNADRMSVHFIPVCTGWQLYRFGNGSGDLDSGR